MDRSTNHDRRTRRPADANVIKRAGLFSRRGALVTAERVGEDLAGPAAGGFLG
jgi:hypothetical protein